MDDEQGPWWTRPPEPGPQARAGQSTGEGDQTDAYADSNGYADSREYAQGPRYYDPYTEPAARYDPPAYDPYAEPVDSVTDRYPPVDDGIFATFSGPIPQVDAKGTSAGSPYSSGYGAGDGTDDLHAYQRESRPRSLPHLRLPNIRLPEGLTQRIPEGRGPLVAAAGGLVVLVIVLVALLSGGDDADSQAAGSAGNEGVSAADQAPGAPVDGLRRLNSTKAASLLDGAGQSAGGAIVEAWEWKDGNGRNLVVTSAADADRGRQKLQVLHVARLDRDQPKRLRRMLEPNLPSGCNGGGEAQFSKNAIVIRDLNRDGIAEVTAGWWSRCEGKRASEVRLALLSNGDKYILRGRGVIGDAGNGASSPDPDAADWPKGFLKTLTTLFRKLYY